MQECVAGKAEQDEKKITVSSYWYAYCKIGDSDRHLLSDLLSSGKQRHCILFPSGGAVVYPDLCGKQPKECTAETDRYHDRSNLWTDCAPDHGEDPIYRKSTGGIQCRTDLCHDRTGALHYHCDQKETGLLFFLFLSIVVNHMTDANPYLFVWNRFLDTVIGIAVGIGVNCISLPRKKQKDILFISGLDDTLLSRDDNLSDYSRVELNRMLDEGANFTLSTMRTPASLMKPMQDIRLKLPVIAMDGAVLYDINENAYLKVYVISHSMSMEVLSLVKKHGLSCFANVVVDDVLMIFYEETGEPVHEALVREMRKSSYRNYVKSESMKQENVVYFMMLYEKKIIEEFYEVLKNKGLTEKLKILKYDSVDYPGYSYIKIYNKNATREHMTEYLKAMLDLKKTVTFGSIEGKYDIVIRSGDSNRVVRELKKRYEVVKWRRTRRD